MASSSQRSTMLASLIAAFALTMLPLPDMIDPFRPDWVLFMLIFWTIRLPDRYSVGTAWLAGIILDVVQGTYLGQHALALSIAVFITAKFHLQMRVFPLPQLTMTVVALTALYQFLLFWINGVAGISSPNVVYWGPPIVALFVWPFLSMFMSALSYRPGRSS